MQTWFMYDNGLKKYGIFNAADRIYLLEIFQINPYIFTLELMI